MASIAVRAVAGAYNTVIVACPKYLAGFDFPLKSKINSILNQLAYFNGSKESKMPGEFKADGIKTYLGRTGDLLATCLDHFQAEADQNPTLKKFGELGATLKTTISALDVITQIPATLDAITTNIKVKDNEENDYLPTKQIFDTLLSRTSQIGLWFIGLADATKLWKHMSPETLPSLLKRVQPWIYVSAGTAIAAHFVNKEISDFRRNLNNKEEKMGYTPFIKNAINFGTSAAYLFSSGVLAVSQYSQDPRLEKYRFYAAVGTGVMPVLQRAICS